MIVKAEAVVLSIWSSQSADDAEISKLELKTEVTIPDEWKDKIREALVGTQGRRRNWTGLMLEIDLKSFDLDKPKPETT